MFTGIGLQNTSIHPSMKIRTWYSRVLVRLELWPLHDEQPGQDVDEDPLHPRRHLVRLRRPEVHVQHHHRHRDAVCVKEEEEEKAD